MIFAGRDSMRSLVDHHSEFTGSGLLFALSLQLKQQPFAAMCPPTTVLDYQIGLTSKGIHSQPHAISEQGSLGFFKLQLSEQKTELVGRKENV